MLNVMRLVAGIIVATLIASVAQAEIAPRDGWVIRKTAYDYQTLIGRVNDAAAANQIGVVTRASATVGAKEVLDVAIPGNMVVGLYHPRFAVRMLEASTAAGIEAPIRVYITEEADGTATLSYKLPSFVFAAYMEEGGQKLKDLATELDALFEKLTMEAAQ